MPVEKIIIRVPAPPLKVIGIPGLPVAANSVSGISQSFADGRYIRLAQINQANGVAGLSSTVTLEEEQLPLPPVDLTLLFENKIA